MNDVVDRVMTSYEKLPAIEGMAREEIRVKLGQYLAKLSSAGHNETSITAWPICASFTKVPILGTRAANVAFP